MKVVIDREKCTGLGICESLVPEVFEINDAGALVLKTELVPEALTDLVERAARSCPTAAIEIER